MAAIRFASALGWALFWVALTWAALIELPS